MEGRILRYADANVIKIKHAVLEEVARLAFAGELEERKDEIPMKLIPGTDCSVPLLYLQGERDHQTACPSGRGKGSGA